MPIMKETTARLVKEKIPYEIISREVVQSITNPVALAIYAYLITLPENWTVRRKHLLEHFDGLGRERYDAAMKHLKELGLVWIAVTRDGGGQIIDRTIVVEILPKVGKPTIRENPQVGKPTSKVIRPLRDTDSVRDTDITKDTDSSLSKRSTRFIPPTVEQVAEYVSTRDFKIDPETFVDWNASKGWLIGKNKMIDWKAAVRTWEKREKTNGNKNRPINGTQHNNVSSSGRKQTVAEELRAKALARRTL